MARRPPTRWLAPIAIVVVGGAAYGILKSGGDSSPTRTTSRPASQRSGDDGGSGAGATTTTAKPTRTTYVVRSGDTLSAISLETGVSVARLQSLNPDVDVQALQPGQRLKLGS